MKKNSKPETKGFVLRLLLCVLFSGFCLYSFIDQQNEVTEVRIKLPKVAKEIRAIVEESRRLQYEIEQFENPGHLMQLARRPEYSHLKHPLVKEITMVGEGVALKAPSLPKAEANAVKPSLTLATGANTQH